MNIYKTQIKRELWENKVSFIYAPAVVSLLILALVLCAALYSGGVINDKGVHFNMTSNGVPVEAGVTVDNGAGVRPADGEQVKRQKFDMMSSIVSDSGVFNGMISGVMYANCVLLYLVFSVVFSAYALRCLFDDRKNKDILFWRSMPVSETSNVLTKLAMIFLVGPLIITVLNFLIVFGVLVIGGIYFTYHGVGLGYLLSSVIKGGSYYVPLQILYELILSLFMLAPVIGLALFASAYAKKTPFFIFSVPFLLILADEFMHSAFGIKLGIAGMAKIYGNALTLTQDAFLLQHPLHITQAMFLPFILCTAVGGVLVAGAIWLRNNRYEI